MRGFFNVREELSIWIDCCLARGQLSIIPSSLRCKVLAVAHEGHLGMVRMKQRCRGAIWWPGIDRDIEGLVRECEACILSGKSVHPHVAPLQLIPWPSQPWDKIQIDIVGELHVAPQNYRYLIVVHDLCSKWPEVCPTSQIGMEQVVGFLEDLFAQWGLPSTIGTNNGPQFSSGQFETFLHAKGIRHVITAYYHPQSNGGVEMFNQVLKQGYRAYLSEKSPFRKLSERF